MIIKNNPSEYDKIESYRNEAGIEHKTYYKNNKIIYFESSNGYWSKHVYNKKNLLVNFKNSSGYESWYEYDSDGGRKSYRNSDGYSSNLNIL